MWLMSTKTCTVGFMTTRSLDDFRENLDERAARVRRAEDRLTNERAALKAVVLDALAAGMPENEVHRLTGLSRTTVREWAGKQMRT
jgi:DNA invertase Pin-like site-specific DNA recombinase